MQYVAFLRAINVGGHAVIRMTDVCQAFSKAGAAGVRSCIQSGNILFESTANRVQSIAGRAGRVVQASLGKRPEIILRTVPAIERTLEHAPFTAGHYNPRTKLYVVFLARSPKRPPAVPLVCDKEGLEVIGVRGTDVFVVSRLKPNGFFGMPNLFIEEALGVPATTRNVSTLSKIVALARS